VDRGSETFVGWSGFAYEWRPSGSGLGWTSTVDTELTAENRPAQIPPGSVVSTASENQTAHEGGGRAQVLVVLPYALSPKPVGPLRYTEKSRGGG